MTGRASPGGPKRGHESSGRWLGFVEKWALLIVWAAVIVVFSIARPSTYFTGSNFSTIFGSQTPLLIVAIGVMIPLIVSEYDLSIAYNVVVSSIVLAYLNVNMNVNIGIAIVAVIALSTAVGAINASLVVLVGVDSFVATLGTGTFLGGIALWVSNSQTIGGVSQSLVNAVVVVKLFSVPIEFYYGLVIAVVVWLLLRFTPLGLRMLYVGRSHEVARLSGVAVGRVRFGSLMASGLLAGIAAVISAGGSGSADPTANIALLLPAFAAAFLGATAITPGRFNPWGTVASVYFLVSGITGLELIGAGTYVQSLFYGGALVFAVALSIFARRRREARAQRFALRNADGE